MRDALGRCRQSEKARQLREGRLGARQHVLVAHDVQGRVGVGGPAAHMGAPRRQHIGHAVLQVARARLGVGHHGDGDVGLDAEMIGQRQHHVERVAHHVDGAGGQRHVDAGMAVIEAEPVMRLDEDGVGRGGRQITLHRPAQRRDLFRRHVDCGAAAGMGREEARLAIAQRQLVEPVGLDRRGDVAHQIVQEGAQPGVARFGIGRQPQDPAHWILASIGENQKQIYLFLSERAIRRQNGDIAFDIHTVLHPNCSLGDLINSEFEISREAPDVIHRMSVSARCTKNNVLGK